MILIALAIASGTFFIPDTLWFIIGALSGLIGYLLFWLIQFAGVTQMEQFKVLFDRLSYEINSQQVLIKISSKQGMPIGWDKIKRAYLGKDHFLLVLSKAQIIYLPFRVFNTSNENKIRGDHSAAKGIHKII